MWIINYKIIETISQTKLSSIYKAINKQTGNVCVIKNCFQDSLSILDFKEQVDISRQVSGLVKVNKYRFFLSNDEKAKASNQTLQYGLFDYIAVTDYYQSFSALNEEYLKSFGSNDSELNPIIRSKIIHGIATIMASLHSKNIVHTNLKI